MELLEAISIKSIKEGGKETERYHVFGLGLENFTGHITPVVLGESRFTLDYYSHPFQLQIVQTADQHGDSCASSRTAQERSRHSLATVLQSTAWPLFSTSGGNESTWAAMLL